MATTRYTIQQDPPYVDVDVETRRIEHIYAGTFPPVVDGTSTPVVDLDVSLSGRVRGDSTVADILTPPTPDFTELTVAITGVPAGAPSTINSNPVFAVTLHLTFANDNFDLNVPIDGSEVRIVLNGAGNLSSITALYYYAGGNDQQSV